MLPKGALIILNTGAFNKRNFAKANIDTDPRETGELDDFQVVEIDVSAQTLEAVKPHGLSKSDAEQCKNFWALGCVLWMFGRNRDPIKQWATKKFAKKAPEILTGNMAALDAGHAYAETAELSAEIPQFAVGEAPMCTPRGIVPQARGKMKARSSAFTRALKILTTSRRISTMHSPAWATASIDYS